MKYFLFLRVIGAWVKLLIGLSLVLFDRAFWREFIEVDTLEEWRMMHEYE